MRITAFIVALALLASGCREGNAGADVDVERIEQIPVQLTVKLRGDVNVTLDKQVVKSTFVVRRLKDKEQFQNQVMGVEAFEPVAVANMLIKPGFSVVPFTGDGKYTFKPGSPHDAVKEEEEAKRTGKPRQRSSVKVEWWPTSDINGPTELFLRRLEPCKATVQDDATRGRVFCPVVTDEQRTKKFSFEFVWDVPETAPGEGK